MLLSSFSYLSIVSHPNEFSVIVPRYVVGAKIVILLVMLNVWLVASACAVYGGMFGGSMSAVADLENYLGHANTKKKITHKQKGFY